MMFGVSNAQNHWTQVDTNATGTNIPVANSVTTKAGRPRLNNAGEERKSAELGKRPLHETKKPHDTDTKGSSNETRDKPLEVPKIKDANGNQSLESGSNPKTPPLEDPPVEGCDPSNRCIDEKNKFVACLRVPGKGRKYYSSLYIDIDNWYITLIFYIWRAST